MSEVRRVCLIFMFLLLLFTIRVSASEYIDLYHILDQPQLQTENTFTITNTTLEHHDLLMNLDSGRIAFFEPILLDSNEIIFGGYFEGSGNFRFNPSNQMEKDQLYRFFHSDSLNRTFSNSLLFFTPEMYKILQTSLTPSPDQFDKDNRKTAEKLYKQISRSDESLYAFEHLRNIIHPFGRGFFLTVVSPINTENICYMFNPYFREEVNFAKEVNIRGQLYTEWINRYSQYSTDESYYNINGRKKYQLDVTKYKITAELDNKGVLTAKSNLTAMVLSGPTQCIEFELMPTLHIDSIIAGDGSKVPYVRKKYTGRNKDLETSKVGLILPRPVMFQDSLQLTFYYQGEIAVAELGEMYIFTGAEWYPRYGFRDRAEFELKFITDSKYEFVATGSKIDQKIENNKKITNWKVIPETSNVAFNLGYMKKYRFKEDDVVPVDIYFSKSLHAEIATFLSSQLIGTGSNMEEQVSSDIINAIRVFEHSFGKYPLAKISATEVFSDHGEAFPGFLHLGFNTWVNTDSWGEDRIFRSHEVAHQWWGVDVGYETYHDQWLSEGFATYSSLMYLQVVEGNEMFFNKLREYRNDIFSARSFILGSGEESGPVALGYRTSSTETKGDFRLIIYKKGAFILHMLRNMLIDLKTMNGDLFLEMLREFYSKYRGKAASTQDFKRIAEKYCGIDLNWFFNQWVNHNYLPESEFSYEVIQDKTTKLYTVKGHIVTKQVPDDFIMYMPLEIQFENEAKAYLRLFIDKSDFTFDLPDLNLKPKKLILNPFESVLAKIKQ